MDLSTVLAKAFNHKHLPHIYHTIYEYVYDLANTAGIPEDIHAKLTKEFTEITVDVDGITRYTVEGKLHRLDGPAVIYSDSYEAYYVEGKLHRLDGPAIIDSDGYEAYYMNGKKHRLDGPATIYADGSKEYWIEGKRQY